MSQAVVGKLFFDSGTPLMTKWEVTGSDVAYGDVVEIRAGQLAGIVHSSAKIGDLVNLGKGHGTYVGVGDAAISIGDRVYWDAGAGKVTTVSTTNPPRGVAVSTCAGDGQRILIEHVPTEGT